jgi:hypothetical protein
MLAAIDDEIMAELLGPIQAGKALVFEDQYISSAGQLYELVAGHDRFTADLRPLMPKAPGVARELCAHPYDLGAMLIAEEAGVAVTDMLGGVFDAPLDVTYECAWAGYANSALRAHVEPALHSALRRRSLI